MQSDAVEIDEVGALASTPCRERRGRAALRNVRNVYHPDFRTLRPEQTDRLVGRSHHHDMAVDGVVGRRLHPARVRGNPVRHYLFGGVGADATRLHCADWHRAGRALRNIAAGGLPVRQLYESRAVSLPADSDQLALLRLRHFQRRVHLPLLLADLSRHQGGKAAETDPAQLPE